MSDDLRDLRFCEVAPEQFWEFWESHGWDIEFVSEYYRAIRDLRTGQRMYVECDGELVCDIFSGTYYVMLGDALDAANRLADYFGGWAE